MRNTGCEVAGGLRPEIRRDLAEASTWYEQQRSGLGSEFVTAVLEVFESLTDNPHLNARRSRRRHVRWRLPQRFPYRVVYEVRQPEQLVLVVAVLHSARHDRHWQRRLD